MREPDRAASLQARRSDAAIAAAPAEGGRPAPDAKGDAIGTAHNVLLGPDGPRVIDFGLSRVLDAASAVSSRAVGTPAYMAPEQVSGQDVGAAADVFAWGATMTFAATGRPPFGSDSIPAVMYRVLHHEPDLGVLDGELLALVGAALAKDPARRPTAAQLLLRLVGHEDAFDPAAATATAAESGASPAVPVPGLLYTS
ncbi:protein kinase, partial [Actinomadura sp. BRA 177]|uniref:protein kinase domain-containing protein n=1 Tax=Actinomadura sp. BRA 177 TaxID=2745202 RepID=UPI0020CBF052